MKELDALLADAELAPPMVQQEVTERKCRRHVWAWVEVHNELNKSPIPDIDGWRCARCGKPKDETRSRRGKLASRRGRRIQRERIVALGGRNLAGNNPNLDGLGEMFAYESKSGGAFSQRVWRWLTDIPKRGNETGVLIVTETPGPGRKARSYVVVEYGEWRDLHGEDAA